MLKYEHEHNTCTTHITMPSTTVRSLNKLHNTIVSLGDITSTMARSNNIAQQKYYLSAYAYRQQSIKILHVLWQRQIT